MGFPSTRLAGLLSTLAQPPAIAAILSVGIHGALFAVGPTFASLGVENISSADFPELQERPEVPLMELSPEELNQLPDALNPNAVTPSGNIDPELQDLLNSLGSGSTSGLSGSSSSSSATRPKTSDATPPSVLWPQSIWSPEILSPPLGDGSSGGSSGGNRPSTGIPGGASGSTSTPSTSGTRTAPGNTAGAKPADSPAPDGDTPANAEGDAPTNDPDQPSTSADDLKTPSADSAPLNEGDQVAARGNRTNDEEDAESALQAYLQARQYHEDLTAAEDVEAARDDWTTAVREASGIDDLEAEQVVRLEMPYGRRNCLNPKPNDALVGILLEPEKGLVGDPTLLKSTGYPFLNEEAIAAIAQMDLPEVQKPTALQLEVKVIYDPEVCVDLGAIAPDAQSDHSEQSEAGTPQPSPSAPLEDNSGSTGESSPTSSHKPQQG